MPTVTSVTYGRNNAKKARMSRVWVRNGKGPYVPHTFSFSCARILRDEPGITNIDWSLDAGGAGSQPGNAGVLENELYTKLRSKAYTQFQGGVNIGQLGQTLTMLGGLLSAVRHPLKTLGNLMRRAANNRRGVPVLKDVSEGILLFNYGIKPFMQDMHDLCTVLQKTSYRTRVKASVSRNQRTYFVPDEGTHPYRSCGEGTAKVCLSGGFTMVVTNPNLFAAEQMGFLNPAAIIWELVPFSFVLDWFLPLGTYFNSWSDYAGVTQVNGWKTAYTKALGTRAFPGLRAYCTDESCTCVRSTYVPTFTASNMRLNLSQSATHIVNGVSLILANARLGKT